MKRRPSGLSLTASPTVLVAIALALIAGVDGGAQAAETENEYSFHRDHILGTSFDMKVCGVSKLNAEACQQAVLAEIERLNKILNSRNSDSEISQLTAAKSAFKCSADLYNVMKACNSWRIRTAGAFNANVGELSALWKAAVKSNELPTARQLNAATASLQKNVWRLDTRSQTVESSGKLHLMIDGLAKGYIIDKALAAGRKHSPQANGLLIDIGGDIAAWSAQGKWLIDVADPFRSEDNAPPMTTLGLTSRSIATSGSYARHFKIGAKRYSQIIDPRSGRPADGVVSATVLAADTLTADAMATALCVMTPYKGIALTNRLTGVECLIVDAKGKKHQSKKWPGAKSSKSTDMSKPTGVASSGQWPKDYSVTIGLTLRKNPPSRKKKKKYHRPYVGVMIVSPSGKPVKTLALWVERKTKYDKELRGWYRMGSSYRSKTRRAVSRGTRGPGAYTLLWDGKDDDGKPVKQGTYGVFIEISREGGSRVSMRANIKCQTSPYSARMAGNDEATGAWAKYGPRK
jgi:FAD:protein FMN transferase